MVNAFLKSEIGLKRVKDVHPIVMNDKIINWPGHSAGLLVHNLVKLIPQPRTVVTNEEVNKQMPSFYSLNTNETVGPALCLKAT